MEKLKELNEIKHDLIDAVKSEIAGGIHSVNTEELGAVVDMIKDLASAEKDCMEACYYETVTEAMTEGEEKEGSYGYDRWRYASGRFAPKGRGSIRGYLPPSMPTMEDVPYTGRHTMNDRMGNRMGYDTDTVEGIIETMGDMWSKADQDMKRKMRTHVEDFLHQMKQEEL